MPLRRVAFLIFILCLIATLSSCLARRRAITRKGAGASKSPSLLTANRETLVNEVAKQYAAVHDFSATVDMVPALGSVEKNKVTEYKDVRAYILYKEPSDIRLIGLYPVVRNTAFDMVSTGPTFNLYVPSRNRFITGRNEIVQPSANKLENLRPTHFLDAIMVHPVTPSDKVLLENLTDEDDASYILHLVREPAAGELKLTRTIWFSRIDLTLSRQLILDDAGNILTDARYSDWRAYDNVRFPKHIEINRPRDEYGVVIDVVKMDINQGVSDDKFVLKQPEGSVRQVVGEAPPQ